MEELFLQLVAAKVYLYDKSHKDYKDTNLKLKTWADIGAKFNKTGNEAQIVFKSLREKYVREKKCMDKSRFGYKRRKQWNLFPLMSFLEDHVKPRNTMYHFNSTTNTIGKATESHPEPVNKMDVNIKSDYSADITEYITLREDSPSCSSSTIIVPVKENTIFKHIPTKKTMKENDNDKEESVIHQYNNENNSKYAAFCANLNNELNNMPARDAEDLKDEITMSLLNKRKEIRKRIC